MLTGTQRSALQTAGKKVAIRLLRLYGANVHFRLDPEYDCSNLPDFKIVYAAGEAAGLDWDDDTILSTVWEAVQEGYTEIVAIDQLLSAGKVG